MEEEKREEHSEISKKSKIPDILTEEQKVVRENLKCRRCGSKQVYTLVSGIHQCRKCGYSE